LRSGSESAEKHGSTRILVAQTSFLGDVVLSTPVFASLKRHRPGCHVTVWLRPEAAPLLEGHPHVDAVLVDDKRGADRGLAGMVRIGRALRLGEFDVALTLHRSLRTALLVALARIPHRIGFRQSSGWFLYHRLVTRDASRHEVERNLSILEGLGIDPRDEPAELSVASSAEAQRRVATLLQEVGLPPQQRLVALAPGSAWATKRWTTEGYAEVARTLQRAGFGVLLLGSGDEAGVVNEVAAQVGEVAVNLVGRTSIPELVAAIDRCSALICNDSAPMHIAVARKVPVVAIFGPTHPRQGFAPYSKDAVIVQRDLACRPCSRHGGARCPIRTHACMRGLTAAEVLAAVRSFLPTHHDPTGP
jgi:heptosyltransferase-2